MHVVAGYLAQPVFFETIDATVANPATQHEFPIGNQHHHGRADQVDAACGGSLQQIGIDLDQGVLDRLDEVEGTARRSEEHTSELQSLMRISYAVFCLKKKNIRHTQN